MHFGYKPSFYGGNYKTTSINAKAENLITSRMWKPSLLKRRCLVIADSFIEGSEEEKLSKPYVFYLPRRPFAMAGIYDEYVNEDSGEIYRGFAIVTTKPTQATKAIGHHRSPVILSPDMEEKWLFNIPMAEHTGMLYPNEEFINAYPIADGVKSRCVNSVELLKPIGQRIFKEYDYRITEKVRLGKRKMR